MATKECKLDDNLYVSVDLGENTDNNEYSIFCNRLRDRGIVNELSENDKLKLFLLSKLVNSALYDNSGKIRSGILLPNKDGDIYVTPLYYLDQYSIKGTGEVTLRRNFNTRNYPPVTYLLNFTPNLTSEQMSSNKDFVYGYLVNRSKGYYKWHNPIVAGIISSCIVRFYEKQWNISGDYYGEIDWQRLTSDVKSTFGAIIKPRKAKSSNIWNVYTKIIETIRSDEIAKMIKSIQPVKNGELDENALVTLVNEINQKNNIEIKVWQVRGMMKQPISSKNLLKTLLEIVEMKL